MPLQNRAPEKMEPEYFMENRSSRSDDEKQAEMYSGPNCGRSLWGNVKGGM